MTQDNRDFDLLSSGNIDPREFFDGHIIRFNTDRKDAFVFIEKGVDGEYRWVSSRELRSLDPLEEGQAFILWQRNMDPDSQVSLFFPAIPHPKFSEEYLAERNRLADERIKTLDELEVDIY